LRGVQFLVAITVVAELGDLTRFTSPRQLAAFVGQTRRARAGCGDEQKIATWCRLK